MSSFLKAGKRQSINKVVKFHKKGFFKSLELMNAIAEELKSKGEEVTEDNVEQLAKELIGREIDSMEKFLIMGKIFVDKDGK